MSLWKQFAASLAVVALAGGLWVWFFPGAPDTLRSWGLDWAAAAVPEPAAPGGQQGGAQPGPRGPAGAVVTRVVQTGTINDTLSAIGTGRALNSVSVTPFTSGRMTELVVASGARVTAGDVIARLDSEAEEIALDRANIALADASARLDRVTALRTSNAATVVQVTEAELAVSNARLAVRDAELTLQRRAIVAPIAGIVGILPVSVGNLVTTQTEIATIDDRSRILVDFWVPERFASAIEVSQPVSASSVARPSEVFDGVVSAVDNRVDAQSRTLRVEASIDNETDELRAGMSFQMTMRFPGETFPAVDPLAIQWGADGAFVWAVQDGRAKRTPVRIIQRNTDSVLVAGDFADGVAVVTEGIHAVREGAEVRVVEDGGETQPAEPQAAAAGTGT